MKEYYSLTKPGIIRGNLFSAVGGFFLASNGEVDVFLFLATLLGTIFVIAAGCVFNNYIDRKIDAKMERTQKRALATGVISGFNALLFGSILGLISLLTFSLLTNTLTVIIAAAGFVFYVIFYSYFKRKTIYGTLIGGVSGAIPPVIGYTAVTQRIDMGGVLLFLILLSWQMPHFYAIGIYRLKEYKSAGLPLLSIIKGIHLTKIHIVLYIVSFILFSSSLTLMGYTGLIYLVVLLTVGLIWLLKSVAGFGKVDDNIWARKIFTFSLVVLVVFCTMISIDFALPF